MNERKDWLIYDRRSECYWGPNRGGYFKSLADAGLYTEAEARAAEDFANRYDRAEVARPLSEHMDAIRRLAEAVGLLAGPDGRRAPDQPTKYRMGGWPIVVAPPERREP